ncbi:SsrA-binding protein SmpB [Tissierella praeacuta]|uniref:SsrA-binding protein SmpB n=1 Tax=Tissierella praeacuta TaxID=43131 RepID=UPI0033423207
MKKTGIKVVGTNRKARFEYFIEDTIEAGLVLTGTEVKSVRQGKLNIKDSYASIEQGEVFINNLHISPYEQGNIYNVDPLRKRKLLLHKREIRKLMAAISQKGYTLVALSAYIKNGLVKIELATAKGKKLYDKRDDIAKKDAERRMQQHASEKYRA